MIRVNAHTSVRSDMVKKTKPNQNFRFYTHKKSPDPWDPDPNNPPCPFPARSIMRRVNCVGKVGPQKLEREQDYKKRQRWRETRVADPGSLLESGSGFFFNIESGSVVSEKTDLYGDVLIVKEREQDYKKGQR